jgi:hypothetical protein
MRFLDVNEENNGRMPRGRRVMDYAAAAMEQIELIL